MADNDFSKFKISLDDEGPFDVKAPKPPIQGKIEDLRIKKLNRKINLFAILMPLLLALIFVFGYFDIRKRSDSMAISGTPDIQALSRDLDSKFSSLSVRQAKLEAMLNTQLSEIKKTVSRFEKQLEQTQQALSAAASSAPGKEKITEIMAEVEKALAPVHADIKKLASEIKKISSDAKSLQDRYEKEFDKLATAGRALQKEIGLLKSHTDALAASRVDKKTFELNDRFREKFYQQKRNDLEKSLLEKIDALRRQLSALEKPVGADAAPGKQPPLSAPPPAESIPPAQPQPGKIIEQEIGR